MPTYDVVRLAADAPLDGPDAVGWSAVPGVAVGCFHPQSSDHRPTVTAQLAVAGAALHLRFVVADRYVLARQSEPNSPVCTDSCVEFFVAPIPGRGYCNIEINAGGTLHLSHFATPAIAGGTADFVDPAELRRVRIASTLPRRVDPEIAEPTTWRLSAAIPLDLLARKLGCPVRAEGAWRGNFFKCADHSSHPHWASWAPIGERLAFHHPDRLRRPRDPPRRPRPPARPRRRGLPAHPGAGARPAPTTAPPHLRTSVPPPAGRVAAA